MSYSRVLREAFGQLGQAYSDGNGQHDAGEFIILLFDLLNNAFLSNGQCTEKQSASPFKNPIKDNFEMALIETVHCTQCDHQYSKTIFETHLFVSVPKLQENIEHSIGQLIYESFINNRREQLCNNCTRNCWHRVDFRLLHAPPILMVNVRRTYLENGIYVKKDFPVKIKKILTMRNVR